MQHTRMGWVAVCCLFRSSYVHNNNNEGAAPCVTSRVLSCGSMNSTRKRQFDCNCVLNFESHIQVYTMRECSSYLLEVQHVPANVQQNKIQGFLSAVRTIEL
jgi:hypothetical protein